MKKLLNTCLAILILFLFVRVQMVQGSSVSGSFTAKFGGVAVGGEELKEDHESVSDTGGVPLGGTTDGLYIVTSFTASGTYTPTLLKIKVARVGSGGTAKEAVLFADNGSETEPTSGGPLCTGTDVDVSGFSTDATLQEFPFSGCPEISSGTVYWVGLHEVDDTGDSSNRLALRYANSGAFILARSVTPASWVIHDGSAEGVYGVYGQ